MEENLANNEVVETAVEEAAKHLDGESFVIGAVMGVALTGGGLLFVKKVLIPVTRRVKNRISERKAAKIAEFEKSGFEEETTKE